MKRLTLVALVVFFVAMGVACGLNPQPFPPDGPDGSNAGLDGGKGGGDATAFGDVGTEPPDAETDSAPVPESDAASDADASFDADASDASDAEVDAQDAALD